MHTSTSVCVDEDSKVFLTAAPQVAVKKKGRNKTRISSITTTLRQHEINCSKIPSPDHETDMQYHQQCWHLSTDYQTLLCHRTLLVLAGQVYRLFVLAGQVYLFYKTPCVGRSSLPSFTRLLVLAGQVYPLLQDSLCWQVKFTLFYKTLVLAGPVYPLLQDSWCWQVKFTLFYKTACVGRSSLPSFIRLLVLAGQVYPFL